MQPTLFLLVLLFVIGIILLITGIRLYRQYTNVKEIADFPLDIEPRKINFEKSGAYSVTIVGAAKIDDLHFRVTSEDNKRMEIYTYGIFSPTFLYKRGIGVTAYYFIITQAGYHTITFRDLEKLEAKTTNLLLTSLFTKNIPAAHLSIKIKEHKLNWRLTLGMLLVIISSWAILFPIAYVLLNPSFRIFSK
ncbi:hypothetical protein ACLI1A_17965 [Flavobacterium sp. RHBU_3]|uniref:hypothetical protein n=1 Tax=Flavobacterium sp. RHBU_3 TaxID=3391184 RepID=UPI003984FC09